MGVLQNSKNAKKKCVNYPRYFTTENINFSLMGLIFCALFEARDRATKSFRFGSNSNINIQPRRFLSYKRDFNIIPLSTYLRELIATAIFSRFLNIYKILRISREQNFVAFEGLKSHPVHRFI